MFFGLLILILAIILPVSIIMIIIKKNINVQNLNIRNKELDEILYFNIENIDFIPFIKDKLLFDFKRLSIIDFILTLIFSCIFFILLLVIPFIPFIHFYPSFNIYIYLIIVLFLFFIFFFLFDFVFYFWQISLYKAITINNEGILIRTKIGECFRKWNDFEAIHNLKNGIFFEFNVAKLGFFYVPKRIFKNECEYNEFYFRIIKYYDEYNYFVRFQHVQKLFKNIVE